MVENNGAYDLEGVIWHQHSNKLMKAILELWKKEDLPVVDIGCGHNFYVSVFKYAGYAAVGVDLVDLGSKHFFKVDITRPFLIDVTYPSTYIYKDEIAISHYQGSTKTWKHNVLSLEVGEHIPSEKSDIYIDNIVAIANGGDVILSWAMPGQAGHGHINCQTNEWVRERMAERGYSLDANRTAFLRGSVDGCHCSWFLNTLMYFHYIEEA